MTRLIEALLAPPRRVVALMALAGAGVLAAALYFQYVLGYLPCVLCIYQRIPYATLIVIAALVLGPGRDKPEWARLALPLMALAMLIDAGIAGFHVGVEQHWWEGTSSCGSPGGAGGSLDDLRAQIMAAPVVRCDQVSWTMFGISMAGYNVFLSLGMAAYAALAFVKAGRGK